MLESINITDVVKIAKQAGNAIMSIYHQDFEVSYKLDDSPLTQADQQAHQIIECGLEQLTSDIPILSEEGRDIAYEQRKVWEYFWLVDPLDGTKEFVKKNDEFTVNIALIHQQKPILGVVYAPALDVVYWADVERGAYKNAQPITDFNQTQKTCRIVASRSHQSPQTQAFIDNIQTNKEKEIVSIGSSLKLCLVAEGSADVYPRLAPTMEWDTAAAHAIANAAGAKVLAFGSEQELVYNKENLLNPFFVVAR